MNIYMLASQLDLSPLPQAKLDSATPLETVLGLAFTILGSISLIVIIISGIRFMTANGDPEALKRARNTIIYAAIGLAVALGSGAILSFVVTQVGS